MKSVLRATAVLSTSSMVSILVGLVATKFWAIFLGPSGLGFMGLLQNLVGLTGLIAGLGIGAGIVRQGSAALARENTLELATLRRAAWLLCGIGSGIAMIVLVVFRTPLSLLMLGSTDHGSYVVLMAVPLIFSLASGIQTSLLNAHHRIGALAKIGMLNSVLSTAVGLGCVWLWHERGIAPAIITNSLVAWALSVYWLRREITPAIDRPTWPQVFTTARGLARFGLPYTASMLVGTGVQMALPALVLHLLGIESVGFYRAALAISVSYLGFLLAAMAQDYYPRISAASDRPVELIRLVNQQHRLVMLLAVPMILGVLALAPYLVPLIYSAQFTPTVEILEWQLIGDLLKFSSWTMAFVILARSGSIVYFATELIGGISTLVASWLGVRWLGLSGLGVGFLVSYSIYYLVVWSIVRREIGLAWTAENRMMMLAALVAAMIIRSLPFIGAANLRTPIALSFAGCASLISLFILWRELGVSHVAQAN